MNELFHALKSVASPIRVGARVRLRNRPDDTGVVIGPSFQVGDVKVRWDEPDAMTHVSMRQLEVIG